MAKKRDLPQAEFEVMDVLWQKGEATIKEVQAELTEKAYTTVATLLSRLKEKSYVEAEVRNFTYVYRPLVEREQAVRKKVDDLVKKVLGGSLEPLAAYIAENRKLTKEQLKVLEEIVEMEKDESK